MFGSRKTVANKTSSRDNYLESGPNTPVSLYDDAAGKFAEIWDASRIGEARMFILAVTCVLVGLAGLATTIIVLPLKQIVPWVVEVNPTNGVVNRPIEVLRIDPNVAVIKAELARWAEAVYSIDPTRSGEQLRWANLRTADKAVGQFAEFRARERIFERINREPELVREVRVTAVDVSQRGTAFIFLTTSERVGPTKPAPDKTKKWRITLNYKMVAATQENDILANPLGLYVTLFSDIEERSL